VSKKRTESNDWQQRLWAFLPHLCSRPVLWTTNGTFEEVMAFLNGFFVGAGVDTTSGQFEFREWLVQRMGYDSFSGPCWDRVLLILFDEDKEEALRQLPRLFHEFTLSR